MSKRTPSKLKFLVNLDMRYSAAREMIGGILRFASAHSELEVQFAGGTPSDDPLDFYREWHPDALITDSTYRQYSTRDLAAISGKVTIFANTMPPARFHKPHAVIATDDTEIARTAADLFQKRRLPHFAFVGTPQKRNWSDSRRDAFRTALGDVSVATFEAEGDIPWREQRLQLANWLSALPKPCGVWVAYDQRAKHVMDACDFAGLSIPDQIQVLGTDNESYICEQLRPSLSSIALDFEGGGFRSAQYAYGILRTRRVPARQRNLAFSVNGIVERLSTADVNGFARRATAARDLIRKYAPRPEIGVPDIAHALGVSQRLLEKNYQAVAGHTIVADLRAERLQLVKDMLRRTKTPIESIAPLCGFTSSCYLKTLFRKTYGMTMSEFRRK